MSIHLPKFPTGWHCYLLLCADGPYYRGIASDLNQRIRDLASGKGAKYTKRNKPIALVWFERCRDKKAAHSREREIKGWNHAKKAALAHSGVWVSLVRLAADSG